MLNVMLLQTYYDQNYAGIIDLGLSAGVREIEIITLYTVVCGGSEHVAMNTCIQVKNGIKFYYCIYILCTAALTAKNIK